jgi:hypothetical protein
VKENHPTGQFMKEEHGRSLRGALGRQPVDTKALLLDNPYKK